MNNHKTYNEIESGITYSVLVYYNDDDNDYKFINKFVNRHENCKIKLLNANTYIPEGYYYHEYYSPGIELSKTTYYKNGIIILEIEEEPDKEKYAAAIKRISNCIEKIKYNYE